MEAAPALRGRYVAVDFMDMTDDRHPWARSADVRPGVELSIGRHVVVGYEDADPLRLRPCRQRRFGNRIRNIDVVMHRATAMPKSVH